MKDMYVGLTPYSPLAAGRLSRAWNASTVRYETDTIAQNKYGTNKEADKLIVDGFQNWPKSAASPEHS